MYSRLVGLNAILGAAEIQIDLKTSKSAGAEVYNRAMDTSARLQKAYMCFFHKSYTREIYANTEEMAESPRDNMPDGIPDVY
jgi:hypothetical protein